MFVAVLGVQLPIMAAVLSFGLQGLLLFYMLCFAAVLGVQLPITAAALSFVPQRLLHMP